MEERITQGPYLAAILLEAARWNIPFNLAVSEVMKLGEQPVSIGAGRRIYLVRAPGALT